MMKQEPIDNNQVESVWHFMSKFFRAHPWHGVSIGSNAPQELTSYIEITPTDTMKFEVDKDTGFLKVDRPQFFSNICPALYGLIPQTYCGEKIAKICMDKTGFTDIIGDGDPLDICILTEKTILHGDILVNAVPVGGFRMIDGKEADDKIIAVLKGDAIYEKWDDVRDLPPRLINRLRHYFLTYKDVPNTPNRQVEITDVYGREEAHEVIRASQQDYRQRFGDLEKTLNEALGKLS